MLIGELADRVGVPSQTIRFYERRGLLPAPARTSNGYRSYDASAAARVRFIRAGQAAGLSLVQIRSILDLRDHGQEPCAHVAQLIEEQVADVRRRIAELTALQDELDRLRERSRRLEPGDCGDADICHILSVAGSPASA
ncbi:MAG: heavy metal-responsive transcriptional regulator [Microbacterium sp. 14-71-5]|nr:MAG: heavy metal-responsive transcriptional regulator [Microbacterium sp. 14-71-5]